MKNQVLWYLPFAWHRIWLLSCSFSSFKRAFSSSRSTTRWKGEQEGKMFALWGWGKERLLLWGLKFSWLCLHSLFKRIKSVKTAFILREKLLHWKKSPIKRRQMSSPLCTVFQHPQKSHEKSAHAHRPCAGMDNDNRLSLRVWLLVLVNFELSNLSGRRAQGSQWRIISGLHPTCPCRSQWSSTGQVLRKEREL